MATILFSGLDQFQSFRPSAWVDRGLLLKELKPGPARQTSRPRPTGINLIRFIQAGVAALAISTSAVAGKTFNVEAPICAYAKVQVELTQPLHSLSGLSTSLTESRFDNSFSKFYVSPSLDSYVAESKVSLFDVLTSETTRVVGQDGVSRLRNFSQLPVGWDSGHGLPLRKESLANFDAFMHRTRIAPPQASVFMTHEGHVVLNWLDADGHVSDLEFGEKKIAYFSELIGDEMVFDLNEALKLKKLLLLPELESNFRPITQYS